MAFRQTQLARLANGRFDVLLAVVLAALATPTHWSRGEPGPAMIDLLACLAAGLTARWPRVAGVALAAVMTTLLFTPSEWSSLGEYAALIPILGTGMRGQRRARVWMIIVYGGILAALTYKDLPGDPMVVFAISVWAALIAVLWTIGNLFTANRKAQETAQNVALQQQRLAVARDLHDTVARDLSRASLRAQVALEHCPTPELNAVVTGIQQASAQLRWMLVLLRDPQPAPPTDTLHGTAAEALAEARASLEARGFTVAITIDGDLNNVPESLTPTLRAVIGESCANIERHADPAQPCAIIVSISDESIDAVFFNQTRPDRHTPRRKGVGLIGVRERLALVGGELATEQEGSQWISRVTVPV